MRPLRIAVVAPARYAIREPYPGGLEAFCSLLTEELRELGHEVDLFAAEGSEGHDRSFELPPVVWGAQADEANDTDYPAGGRARENAALERLADHLAARGYDVVHNNSLHPALIEAGERLPLVTTLHTPCLPEVREAIVRQGANAGVFAAVSQATARDWALDQPVDVVPNGVNPDRWRFGPGGEAAVWFGRIVPEKGLHLAMDAAELADVPLVVAGRAADPRYFESEIKPRLERRAVHWEGELNHRDLNELVRHCGVCIVSPRWEEPFGLVAIEAMACGTPVAAFARGGLGELLAESPSEVAAADDVAGLAEAIRRARTADRAAVREWVIERHSLAATAERYVELYRRVLR